MKQKKKGKKWRSLGKPTGKDENIGPKDYIVV